LDPAQIPQADGRFDFRGSAAFGRLMRRIDANDKSTPPSARPTSAHAPPNEVPSGE
jgi:hypothetical protein